MELDLKAEIVENLTTPDEEIEMQWSILIDQVMKGNVIPVIGSDLTACDGKSISHTLVNSISSLCNMKIPAQSFSQLIPRFNVEHKNDDIYNFVYRVLSKDSYSQLTEPSVDLTSLISIKYFPFVIYTSYDQTVEKAMRFVHGDKLRVLTFDNNADTNDDIPPLDNLKTPTLYYIFGKANGDGHRYVLSDKDILDFSRSWLAETDNSNKAKPANLSNALSNKFLLVLGCNYTDWLFRFFWFAMKDAKIKQKDDCQKIGMLTIDNSANEELIDFLTRSNTLTQNIPISKFINQLKERIAKKENEMSSVSEQIKFNQPLENADVFISYSRADKDIADKLYSVLTEKGLDVWYDKKNLGAGSEFWKDIRYAIRTSMIFVPLLTNSIKRQYRDEHVYRDEWDEAIIRKRRLGNVTYICPLCSSEFDLEDRDSDIPELFKTHNVRTFEIDKLEDNLTSFANEIKSEVLKLKEDDRKK